MQIDNRASADVARTETIPQFIRAVAALHGDAIAIVLKRDNLPDETLTFVELDRRSAALACGLIARGVGKGTRIGFLHGNGPSFAVTLAAIARIGAVAIPISTLIKANELVRVLRQSDVAGLIVQRTLLGHDLVDRLCDALPGLRGGAVDVRLVETPFLRWILSTGEALPPAIQEMGVLTEGAATVSEAVLAAIEAEVHPTDQMLEIYTSGSMALPKGVKHDHGPVLFRTHHIRSMIAVEQGQQVANWLPMFWVGGLMMNLMPNLEVGATTVCGEGTSTNSRIAMGSVLADEDMALMAAARPFWALGMTETLGPYAYGDVLRVPGYPLCAPLDHIAERFEVRIADEDDGVVAEGLVGEIQVRGYALTPGLHKVARMAYFTADGFYRTGDMGLREGTRILFAGREGDVIKSASSNVSPAEVELEIQQLDGVHSAYVVGIPDRERGQLVVAAVVPREGACLDLKRIEAQLRQRLSGFKVPRGYIEMAREDVPMLPSNKVARRQIELLLAAHLGVVSS